MKNLLFYLTFWLFYKLPLYAQEDSSNQTEGNFFDQIPTSNNKKGDNLQDTLVYIGGNAYIQLKLSKQNVKVGEQIIAELNLYSTHTFKFYRTSDLVVSGAYLHDIDIQDSSLMPFPFTSQNKSGYRYLIWKKLIFPSQAGNLEIPVLQVTGTTEIYDASKGSLAVKRNIKLLTKPLFIAVSSLPSEVGSINQLLIGQYSIRSEIKSNNDSSGLIQYQLFIKGYGNMKFVPVLPIETNGDWEAFEPIVSDSFSIINNQLYGERKIIYQFNANTNGYKKLPKIVWKVYDPIKKEVTTFSSVDSVMSSNNPNNGTFDQQLFFYTGVLGDEQKAWDKVMVGVIWALIFLPIVSILFFKWWQSKKKILQFKKLHNSFVNRIMSQLENIDTLERNKSLKHAYHLLWEYLGHKFGLQVNQYSKMRILECMQSIGIEDAIKNEFTQISDYCENQIYGASTKGEEQLAWIARIKAIVNNLELSNYD